MNTTTTTVWEASRPVPRLRVLLDAAKALEYHYRRATIAIWKDGHR